MSKIIIYLAVIINFSVFSQNIEKLVDFEKHYIRAQNDTVKNQILLEKFNYYIVNQNYGDEVFNLGKRIDITYLSKNIHYSNYLWNMALLGYIHEELNFAKSYVSLYANQSKDTSVYIRLINLLIYKNDNQMFEKTMVDLVKYDSIFNQLKCLNFTNDNKELSNKYVRYSKIIPGLGTFLTGEKKKGMVSFFITGLTTLSVLELVKHQLYFNAIGFTLVYWLKFYQGNVYLTKDIIEKKEKEKENDSINSCEVVLRKILLKYPLNFK